MARGFFCELCPNKRDVIFPWQSKIKRCAICGSCYHDKCFKGDCSKCERFKRRKRQLKASTKVSWFLCDDSSIYLVTIFEVLFISQIPHSNESRLKLFAKIAMLKLERNKFTFCWTKIFPIFVLCNQQDLRLFFVSNTITSIECSVANFSISHQNLWEDWQFSKTS